MVNLFYNWILKSIENFSQQLAINSIKFYKYIISPYLFECCIYNISCSDYTKLAILKYGVFKGAFKGLVRLLHCHPFIDMVTKSDLEKI